METRLNSPQLNDLLAPSFRSGSAHLLLRTVEQRNDLCDYSPSLLVCFYITWLFFSSTMLQANFIVKYLLSFHPFSNVSSTSFLILIAK